MIFVMYSEVFYFHFLSHNYSSLWTWFRVSLLYS